MHLFSSLRLWKENSLEYDYKQQLDQYKQQLKYHCIWAIFIWRQGSRVGVQK